MGMAYKWKIPGRFAGVDAQKVGQALEKLESKPGGLQAESVVRAARSPRNPMHPCFEWDDATAAEEYRLEQARLLVRSITVDVEVEGELEAQPVRAFVHVETSDGGRAYTTLAKAMTDDEMRTQVLSRALDEAKAWRRRYEVYRELKPVFEAIDRVELGVAASS